MTSFFALISSLLLNSFGFSTAMYPVGPDLRLTPGALCERPDTYRYPERIGYCNRDVDAGLKQDIIIQYDRDLGFNVENMNRGEFKIDHFIPLCAGGGNVRENLWPQHKSVYGITDPLEPLICEKMAAGRLNQQAAIIYVKKAKYNLRDTNQIIAQVNAL